MDITEISKILSQPTGNLLSKEAGVYKGQWTFYALIYGVRAVYNAYVQKQIDIDRFKTLALPILSRIMEEPAVAFDTRYWGTSVAKDLGRTAKHHLATVSLRCWVLQMYNMITGDYEDEYLDYLDALNARYVENGYSMLRVGPRTPLFLPDNMIGLAVLDNSRYAETAERVLAKAKLDFGQLLPKSIRGRKVSGGYNALTCYYLSLFRDKSKAETLWNTIYTQLHKTSIFGIEGIKERKGSDAVVGMDGDGGPVLNGIGVIATAFSIGSAKKFGPKGFYNNIVKSGCKFEKLMSVMGLKSFTLVGPVILNALSNEKE